MADFINDPVRSTTDSTSAAITAENTNATPQAGVGVHGTSAAAGVLGESSTWHGVAGITQSTTGGAGVFGSGNTGVIGTGQTWVGVFGETHGNQNGPAGVWADGHEGGSGVKGHTSCPGAFGVAGFHLTNQGPGIFGQGSPAGLFQGDVNVTGNLNVQGSDVLQRITHLEQQAGGSPMLTALEQKVAALQGQVSNLQSQVNTAVQNLTGRVTLAEVAISDLKARVTALEV